MKQDALIKNLSPFRRRVRFVLTWRYGAVGGAVGTLLALVMDLGDWFGEWEVEPVSLVLTIAVGVIVGVVYALLCSLPVEAVAQLVDRRAELKDRVTTALLCSETPFTEPLREDALAHLTSVKPSQIFRFRLTIWHGVSASLLVALLVSRFLPDLPLPLLTSFRQDRKEAKQVVENIKRVLKPIVEHAEEPEASKLEKAIAQQLNELYKRAHQGRLTKKEALLKAEKLLAEAEKLQIQSQKYLRQVSAKVVTAAKTLQESLKKKEMSSQMREMKALLERMREIERQLKLPGLTPMKRQLLKEEKRLLQRTIGAMGQLSQQELKRLMEALKQRQAQLQQMLQSGLNAQGQPLTPEERKFLHQQLQNLQHQIRALQLSEQAREFLRKLTSDPNFQEAMKLMAELQKQLKSLQQSQIPQISPEELERMLKELEKAIEELAKRYGDDEKIRELARQVLEAAKRLKEGCTWKGSVLGHRPHFGFGCVGVGAGVTGSGLSAGSTYGLGKGPDWGTGEWVGQPENFNIGSEQVKVNIRTHLKPLTGSQPLVPGPAVSEDIIAPPLPSGSGIPLSRILPTYIRRAEQALSGQQIPPSERQRVRRYFDSLRQGTGK